MRKLVAGAVAVGLSAIAACGSDADPSSVGPTGTAATPTESPAPSAPSTRPATVVVAVGVPETSAPASVDVPGGGVRCVVSLHGKGGAGGDVFVGDDGVAFLFPNGNAEGWGGWQWLYFPADRYAEAVSVVADATADAGCTEVIVGGFSNGAAFAGAMACRGETFGDTVVGYVIDDPVPDGGTANCERRDDIATTLYWTGGLDATAQPGWNCADGDWTCLGSTTVGIDAYAAALGVEITPSPFTDHQPYTDAPELSAWP